MSIFETLMDFFELGELSASATLVDLLQYGISVFVAVYIVCFLIRSLFLVTTLSSKGW